MAPDFIYTRFKAEVVTVGAKLKALACSWSEAGAQAVTPDQPNEPFLFLFLILQEPEGETDDL